MTDIKKGERLEARFQIDDAGYSAIGSGVTYKVQYDRMESGGASGEERWQDVEAGGAENANSGGNFKDWQVSVTDSPTSGGSLLSVLDDALAIGADGNPVISHQTSVASGGCDTSGECSLWVVKCNDPACAGGDETSTIVDDGGSRSENVGANSSIAIGADGNPVISYYDITNVNLKVAKCNDPACAGGDETITAVDSTGDVGGHSSIAIETDGNPVISYYDSTNGDLKVAKYVVSGGTGCASSAWTCTTVDSTGDVGSYTSLAIGADGFPVIAYRDNGNKALKYVDCANATCSSYDSGPLTVDDPGSGTFSGAYISLAVGADGSPVISYYSDEGNKYVKVAKYVGSGGSGCTGATEPTKWKCSNANASFTESSGGISLVIGRDGNPSILFHSTQGGNIHAKLIKCNNPACAPDVNGNSDETITTIDPFGGISFLTLAIGTDGYPVIAYTSGSYLEVAKMLPIAEIQPSWGTSGASGDNLTAAAAGTCYGGTAWQDGEWTEAAKSNKDAVNLGTSKCTELAFMIDTSEAVPGTTYRLRLVENLGSALLGYSYYPTFTISSAGDSSRYSKEAVMTSDSTCLDSGYTCNTVDSTGDTGAYPSLAIGTDGYPVISYYDNTNYDLMVTKCGDASCSSGNVTTCIDSTDDVGLHTSIAIGTDGYPVISYYAGSSFWDLRVAKCNDPACAGSNVTITTLDSTDAVGLYTSLAIGTDGYPVIAYQDNTNTALKFVHCTNASCSSYETPYTIDDPGSQSLSGAFTSIAIGIDSKPIISYYTGNTTPRLKVAKYTGSWTETTCSGSNNWKCSTPDNSAAGQYTSLAIGTDGDPVISYLSSVSGYYNLRVAKCNNADCSSAATHDVESGDASHAYGYRTSIAIGTDGFPVIVHRDVGAGQTSKDYRLVHCTSADCSTHDQAVVFDATGGGTAFTSLAIGTDGYPVIAYYKGATGDLKVSKALGLPTTAISYFGNFVGGDKQIKFKADTANSQFLQAFPAIEDGLKYWFDEADFNKIVADDNISDLMLAGAGSSPVFNFTEKFSSQPTALYPRWYGHSDVAASAKNIFLQVFNFSTNLWQPIVTNTDCSNSTDCVIKSALTSPTYTLSDYFLPRYKYDSQKRTKGTTTEYLTYWRVYQDTAAGSQTLQTNTWTLGLSDTSSIETKGAVNVRGNAIFR